MKNGTPIESHPGTSKELHCLQPTNSNSDTQIAFKGTKWAPTRSKWGYTVIPPKWPCKWVTGLLE